MAIGEGLRSLAVRRAAIGVLQGVLLFLLVRTAREGDWPTSLNAFHAPLLVLALFIPILTLSALGKLPRRTLLTWIAVAAVGVALLAAYDVYRRTGAPDDWDNFAWFFRMESHGDLLAPSTSRVAFLALMLFIAQALVLAGAADRRWFARYPTYFDTGWMLGIQVVLSMIFTGLFWGALELGESLFKMIGVDFLERLFRQDWFIWPATAAAFSLALHVTDVKPEWVRGIRRLALTLFSWLLPLLTLFAVGFLVALPAVGLDSLWKTRYAASLVLAVACCLIALINASYMQGETVPAAILRWSARLAALALVPLTVLGAWAIWLRVGQYGLTSERVVALASVLVVGCYAVGYLLAAIWKGPWLKGLEACNTATAFVVIAVILALISPLADPARLSVASQVARLESGAVTAAKFDFKSLRFDGERYGNAALRRLKETASGTDAEVIRDQATQVLAMQQRWDTVAPPRVEIAKNLSVYPSGTALDPVFLDTDWSKHDTQSWELPKCLLFADHKCDAYVVNLDGEGADEVVIPDDYTAWIFRKVSNDDWRRVGALTTDLPCVGILDALRAGKFTLEPPEPSPWQDIALAGGRLTVRPVEQRPAVGAAPSDKACWP